MKFLLTLVAVLCVSFGGVWACQSWWGVCLTLIDHAQCWAWCITWIFVGIIILDETEH